MPNSQNVFHFYRLTVGAGSEKRSAGDPALDYPGHLVGRRIVEVSPRAAHRRSVRDPSELGTSSAVHLGRGQLAGLATWGLRTQAHDRGVAPDIAKALSFTFDAHHVDRVDLGVSASNSAAIDCYDRAGFVRVGTWPKAIEVGSHTLDVIWMTLMRDRWARSSDGGPQ